MTTPRLTKIDHPPATLRDMVQERMREAIIEGVFQPGERLVERPLCDQLGVSRTVIRETIRYLEAEGLVEILPGRGPIVASITRDEARQIYDIRRMLETAAAENCARNITSDRAGSLHGALVWLKQGFVDKTPGSILRATSDFYSEIFEGAGHHVAWDVVQRLNGRISRLRMMTLTATERDRPGIEHMEAICSAIQSGDPSAARRAVERHLDDAASVAETLFDAEEGLGNAAHS
uniref:GntR family transcriptional regulator n=1 Tax=Ruegeria arenilitoris TaxID=1173585 RepID=UPI00147C671E|nr:GntR family transcriptional regulator [Ruegeria arenilitoris]